MNIEIHKPELERMVREEIQRGHFDSVDDLLTEALQALREKNVAHHGAVLPTQAEAIQRARDLAPGEILIERRTDDLSKKQGALPPDSVSEPFWKGFTRQVHALPNAVFERLPEDGASEHDHYLYGAPKRNA